MLAGEPGLAGFLTAPIFGQGESAGARLPRKAFFAKPLGRPHVYNLFTAYHVDILKLDDIIMNVPEVKHRNGGENNA